MIGFGKVRMVRTVVDGVLQEQEDEAIRRAGYIHLYGVAEMSALLAARRGLDAVTASVAGMLHDIYTCRTGLRLLHAPSGAEDARVILRDLGVFSQEEQQRIHSAILRHSDKERVDDPYDELLKDADVLQHYLHDPTQSFPPATARRIRNVTAELGLPAVEVRVSETKPTAQAGSISLRARLADVAEELARQPLVGDENQSGPDVWPLIRYFPGARRDQGWDWCASFVYHCAVQAGPILPIRYPGVSCRFAAVLAWLEWARLPEIGFFHPADEPGFAPERGDLIVYDRLVSSAEHDHIGVVLDRDDCTLVAAEGNVSNRSGVFRRDRFLQVNGFIRVEDSYRYSWP
ncbi:MAG TPA: hypothetical protein DCL63_12680 [Firmicutes bacterium]|jgi:hypothetical protein|nr:hypothetical protein [Bacillota bacterium]